MQVKLCGYGKVRKNGKVAMMRQAGIPVTGKPEI
jgi:hypothetical protein